jgi:2,4'-dihydroxyacetophenone dioxygenase
MHIEAPVPPAPVDSNTVPWIPLRAGLSFKPLRFFPHTHGWAVLLRAEPGTVIARHRHAGEVHAYHLQGQRKLLDSGEVVGPGSYVYEPPGNVDSWMAVGDTPLIAHVVASGAVEYFDETGAVVHRSDGASQLERYRQHCTAHGLPVLDLSEHRSG